MTAKLRPFPAGSTIARTVLLGASLAALAACGGRERPQADLAASQVTTIGVNSYLWRAALETVSFAPIDTNLIDIDLLDQSEKDWLNHYHMDVFEKIAPLLDDETAAWLKTKTQKI